MRPEKIQQSVRFSQKVISYSRTTFTFQSSKYC